MNVTRLLITAISLCIIIPGITAAAEVPHEKITIQGVRPAVFDHDTHLEHEIKCGVCHHKSKDEPFTDQEVISQASGKTLHCVYCHNENFENEKLRNLKIVMHKQCKSCHQKGFDGKNGPTRCNGCHKDKKKPE